ncbi:MAG: phosphatase PAP2 family protein [Patescibacteria group bacterium]|nr:MAG: phosphatase PAP2 family protein [Patescibacteria group bacterium]
MNYDIELFRAINGLAGRNVSADAVFIFGAKWLIFVMAMLIVAYVAWAWKTSEFEHRVEHAWHITVGFALAFVTERLIGFLWFRPRPFVALPDVVKLIEKSAEEKSFPSGHTTSAFVLAFGLLLHHRKWGAALCVLAAWVSFSRVFVGVHYPTDLLGGVVVAAVAALATRPVAKAIEPYLEFLPVFRKYKQRDA